MPELKRGEAAFLRTSVQTFLEAFERDVADVLRRELGGIEPPAVRELRNELTVLMRQLEMKTGRVRVHPAHAPLVHLTKAQIIRRGVELGVDYGMTHSCYDPGAQGRACGRCDSCLLRKRGFAEAGVPDPTVYA